MSGLVKLEYRVKPRTIWFITRYCEHGDELTVGYSITEEGTFADPLSAQRAANALCAADAASYGVLADDERVVCPGLFKYASSPS